jgi:hypothetical protein
MGFYIRKSFRLGPVRLNLSKSGFGVSAGVKGARIGVNSRGRAYTHAGRFGLYHRQTLGSAGSGARSQSARARAGGIEELTTDTGATYAPTSSSIERDPLLEDYPRRKAPTGLFVFAFLIAVVVALGVLARLGGEVGPAHAALGFAVSLGAAALVFAIRMRARNASNANIAEELAGVIRETGSLTDTEVTQIESILSNDVLYPEEKEYSCAKIYVAALRAVVEDRRVEADELALLTQLKNTFQLEEKFVQRARADCFRAAYFEAIADHELERDEEATLDHLRKELGIPDSAISEDLEALEQLREIRMIREGQLPELTADVKLQKSESCHYIGEGRILKSKVLKRFQQDGQKFNVRGLVIDKEGKLLVTNKRILLVHSGTTSIRFEKIVDLEIDADQNLLSITKDGAQKPVFVTTPDAMKVGAMLATLTEL